MTLKLFTDGNKYILTVQKYLLHACEAVDFSRFKVDF